MFKSSYLLNELEVNVADSQDQGRAREVKVGEGGQNIRKDTRTQWRSCSDANFALQGHFWEVTQYAN